MQFEDESITWLDEHLTDGNLGFAFAKTEAGRSLNAQFSAYIEEQLKNGGIDTLLEKWFNEDETGKQLVDYTALPNPKGTLHMATAATQIPYTYVRDRRNCDLCRQPV